MALRANSRPAAIIRCALLSLLSLPFFAFSYHLVGKQLQEMQLAFASESWTPTPGRIDKSKLARGGGRTTVSYPQIHYTYTVAGNAYEGTIVQYADSHSGRETQEILERFRIGATTIYYSPHAPAVSALLVGPPSVEAYFILCLLVLFGAPGLYLLVLAVRQVTNAL